ncbi:SDR family NAD(P)-dependent oxidoreductase [Crossiella sp. NPDC003009]
MSAQFENRRSDNRGNLEINEPALTSSPVVQAWMGENDSWGHWADDTPLVAVRHPQNFDWSGICMYQTALVTGASSGIGESFARILAARGADLVVVARRTDRLAALASELTHEFNIRVEVLTADLGRPEGIAKVCARLADPANPVDLVVNNAGAPGASAPLHECEAEDEELTTVVNSVAPLRLMHAVLPGMVARGRGGIVNVVSSAALLPYFLTSASYGASKAYLLSLSEAVAMQVKPHGVRVTAVLPGYVRTEMTEDTEDVPNFLWIPKEKIVGDALKALAAGRSMVVPGAFYRVVDVVFRLMPRPLSRVLAKLLV